MSTSPELAAVVADHLAERFAAGTPTTMTWVNHYTAPFLLRSGVAADMDLVGVDGILLSRILGGVGRTSADLVLPILLPKLGASRIVLLGGTPAASARAKDVLAEVVDEGASVVAFDGFAGLPRRDELAGVLHDVSAQAVIVGLGGGLQDQYAAEACRSGGAVLAVTCGGFLDQVAQPRYYPPWAYALRLNWAIRLAREPGRLWRRYTLDAARFVWQRRAYRTGLSELPGLARYEQLVA